MLPTPWVFPFFSSQFLVHLVLANSITSVAPSLKPSRNNRETSTVPALRAQKRSFERREIYMVTKWHRGSSNLSVYVPFWSKLFLCKNEWKAYIYAVRFEKGGAAGNETNVFCWSVALLVRILALLRSTRKDDTPSSDLKCVCEVCTDTLNSETNSHVLLKDMKQICDFVIYLGSNFVTCFWHLLTLKAVCRVSKWGMWWQNLQTCLVLHTYFHTYTLLRTHGDICKNT